MPLIRTPQDIGAQLRAARQRQGWSQARAAAEAGVSRQWLIGVERGRAGAELGRVLRLAAVLGLSLHSESLPADPALDLDRLVETARTP